MVAVAAGSIFCIVPRRNRGATRQQSKAAASPCLVTRVTCSTIELKTQYFVVSKGKKRLRLEGSFIHRVISLLMLQDEVQVIHVTDLYHFKCVTNLKNVLLG